ncbi:sugar phosphate isomerase/epimerase family protein [Alicyclobacillus fodiniaquatilis]|uniref:Sugar phosphate isomerase/epimerase family protein n=1 Tax=Alicyclobacillus fodiniaquatilis TaxID=1661150 RepID=A0ABW4JNU0_9BACL
MDVGLYHSCLMDWDLNQTFQWMSDHNLRDAELYGGPRYPYIDWKAVADGNVETILAAAEKHHIQIHDIMYGALNFLHPDAANREQAASELKTLIRAAKQLGATSVSTFTGRDPSKSFDENLALLTDIFPPFIEYAEQHGVKLLLENCPMYHEWPPRFNIATSPAIWERIFDKLNSPYFGLNLDPSHLVWQGIDYIDAVYTFKDKIHLAQAKDSEVLPSVQRTHGLLDGEFWRHRIAGQGDVNWRGFITALVDVGYKGPLLIEQEDPFFSSSTDAVQTGLELTLAYLAPLVAMRPPSGDYSELKEQKTVRQSY